ncbi:hypothetical protein [Exiguobacterium antarcticum]|uniref:hypothetical protein n=1 Tax=Exiguobacterium antarcticum TaxID=132920 RepID=UPI000285F02C|nr:hypothetical protein [Exiguobacterium antarcticum]AFS70611.1 Hypothetical protein Eab7_1495 [Exiguobacterium antarcticum B7]
MHQTLTNATLIALLTSVGIALPLTHSEKEADPDLLQPESTHLHAIDELPDSQ